MATVHLPTDNFNYFSVLPEEAIIKTFGFLPAQALHNCSHVCSLFNRIIDDDNFPFTEWNKNKCEAGNAALRAGFEAAERNWEQEIPPLLEKALVKTSNPFSDRARILKYFKESDPLRMDASMAFRIAAKEGIAPLIWSLFPFVKGTCFVEQGLCHCIQQGHVHLVKDFYLELPESRLKGKIHITVIYEAKEGESLSLRGSVGNGAYDLQSWEKGYPMQKVAGFVEGNRINNQWEIILIPVVYRDHADEIVKFPVRPTLRLANGEFQMSEETYQIKPGTAITIEPKF